jgi:hypothetical protein
MAPSCQKGRPVNCSGSIEPTSSASRRDICELSLRETAEALPATNKAVHRFTPEVEQFLHAYFRDIQQDVEHYQERFNFALATEEGHKHFGYPFHRNSLRRFALRHGYYHQ